MKDVNCPFYQCLLRVAEKVRTMPFSPWGDYLEHAIMNPNKIIRNLWLQAKATSIVVCEYLPVVVCGCVGSECLTCGLWLERFSDDDLILMIRQDF